MPDRHALAPHVRGLIESLCVQGLQPREIVARIDGRYGALSLRQAQQMKRNWRLFGSVKVPDTGVRRPRDLTPAACDGIADFLLEYDKQALLEEVRIFVEEEYDIYVSIATIWREVSRQLLTRKTVERTAGQRDEVLRRRYLVQIVNYTPEQLCFVDESASNERTAERRYGWSPRGYPCRVRRTSKRSKRWSILPAITLEGYVAWRVYHGSFTTALFNEFIEQQLLPFMRPFPAPCSVLVMDNHSIHHSEELEALCNNKGVHLIFLPPYSPDLNPIEQSFSQLKAWMRKNTHLAGLYNGNFAQFIELAMQNVFSGGDARGHFRACGYSDD